MASVKPPSSIMRSTSHLTTPPPAWISLWFAISSVVVLWGEKGRTHCSCGADKPGQTRDTVSCGPDLYLVVICTGFGLHMRQYTIAAQWKLLAD